MKTQKTSLIAGSLTALFLLHAFLAWKPIREYSATFDEPLHIASGYAYWRTADYRLNGLHHPPLGVMWAAIPLLWLKPILPTQSPYWIEHKWTPPDQYHFADLFLNKNRFHPDTLTTATRAMQIPLSIFLGLCLFFIGWKWRGITTGFLAVALWAVCPNFLMQASIVSTDYAFAIFFFLFFALELLKRRWWRFLLRGIVAGCCLASKYFALSIAPIVCAEAVMLGIYWYRRSQRGDRFQLPATQWVTEGLTIILVALLVLNVVFQFQGLDIWWRGLQNIFTRSQAGRASFLLGHRYTQGNIFYFPVSFLLKTPLPLLISLIPLGVFILRKRFAIPVCLWVPPVAFFFLACLSKTQIGIRYITCVYPFLVLVIAATLSEMKGHWRIYTAGILVWSLATTLLVYPHFIAYFNEVAGGPKKGYLYLTDSNVDWGQALKLLSNELDENDFKNGIYLNYFGTADPHAYQIKYKAIGGDSGLTGQTDDKALPLRPTKFAISVTNLQGTYYADQHLFDWLKAYKPWKVVAHAIFVYDFSQNPEALQRLERLGKN